MRTTLVRLVIATAALVPTTTSIAAPVRTCKLIVDPRGDDGQTLLAPPGQPMDPAFDIVSADVASDPRSITAVIRLADLSGMAAESVTTGRRYDLWFTAGEDGFGMTALIGPDGNRFRVSRDGGSTSGGLVSTGGAETIAVIDGVVDVARNEVRLTAPLSAFVPYYPLRAGDQLWDLAAGTWNGVTTGAAGVGGSVDFAYGDKAVYPIHAPSCVRVGA